MDTLAQKGIALVDSTKQSVVNTANTVDTSRLSKQVYADFKQALAGIASALKVGVEHVYIVLVRQQVVKAITFMVEALLLILVPLLWMRILWKKYWDNSGDACILPFFLFMGLVVAPIIGGFVIILTNMQTIITGFVNPEYGAMTDIMNFIQQIRH